MPARSTASSNAELVWVFREFQYSGKEILKPPNARGADAMDADARGAVKRQALSSQPAIQLVTTAGAA
jgi:hypothetical protein